MSEIERGEGESESESESKDDGKDGWKVVSITRAKGLTKQLQKYP